MTAVDWAADAVALLRENAARNELELEAVHADWREFDGEFDLALAADVLYEPRNVEPLAELLPRLASEALVALAGRPHEREFLRQVETEEVVHRVVRVQAHIESPLMLGRSSPRSPLPSTRTEGRLRRVSAAREPPGRQRVGRPGRRRNDRREPDALRHERNDLIRAAVEAVGERATVVPATGTYSTRHSVRLTKDAHELGADAFLIVTPYYNRPPQRGIVAHFEEIAKASDRPIVVYNIPSRSVVNIEPDTISRLAEIDTVRAVKQANDDLDQARHIVATGLDLYAGDDALLQPFLELGGVGGICVHTHVVGPQVAAQVRAVREGDLDRARELDQELAPVYDLLKITTNPIPIKAALNLTGHEVGNCRLPLVPPTDEELARVRGCLARLGLLVAA